MATSLPEPAQRVVPVCAQYCVSTLIEQDYNCASGDISCLCSNYSSEGLTLGEIALLCLQPACSSVAVSVSIAAYNVCTAQSGAAQPTHTVLTSRSVRVSSTSTLQATSSASTLLVATTSPSQTSRSTLSTSRQSSASASPTAAIIATATLSASISTSSVPATTPSSLGGSSTSLTSAQAAGISIAALGCLMVAVGLVYLVGCIRRRKVAHVDKKRRESYDFIDDAPPRFSPFNHGYADPRGPLGGSSWPRAELPSEKPNPAWSSLHLQADYYLQSKPTVRSISPAEVLDTKGRYHGAPPNTHMSRQSHSSMLLPEKPTRDRSLGPALLPSKSPRPEVMPTPATVFEEDRASQFVELPKPIPISQPAYNPHQKQQGPPRFANQLTRSPEELRQPSLSLKIPKQAPRSTPVPTSEALPPPPPIIIPGSEHRESTGNQTGSTRSPSSFLNYYAEASSPELYSATPIDEGHQTRRPAPAAITVTKATYPPRAVRVSIAASDTSFESNDLDEPTPPEEELERRLTPVAESPLGALKYPKVPRSANQVVPRSPIGVPSPVKAATRTGRDALPSQRNNPFADPQPSANPVTPPRILGESHAPRPPPSQGHTPSLSGSTLVAKRKAAERGLHIITSPPSGESRPVFKPLKLDPARPQHRRHESPLKGYGRVAVTSPAGMKSPLWEPKLTPRRHGDDLYLSVSAATPTR